MKNSVSVEQQHTIISFSAVLDIFQSWKHYTLQKLAVNNGPKYTRDRTSVFCERLFPCIEGLSTARVHGVFRYIRLIAGYQSLYICHSEIIDSTSAHALRE